MIWGYALGLALSYLKDLSLSPVTNGRPRALQTAVYLLEERNRPRVMHARGRRVRRARGRLAAASCTLCLTEPA